MTGTAGAVRPLLEIRGLRTWLRTRRGVVRAVEDVSFSVLPGEKVALVGESGCGKSMTARSILRLLPEPAAEIVAGQILYQGQDLVALDESGMERVRGAEIGMVFQDPLTYLNPRMKIGDQIAEAVRLHRPKAKAAAEARFMLDRVRLPSSPNFARRYPHELSGGMRQRVLIAMALACRPKLLIADEPTTALDVTLQAQILELLKELCAQFRMALILITHDMGVVAELCERVHVMYAGRLVESGTTLSIFDEPRHPYTRALLQSALRIDAPVAGFATVGGSVPDLVDPPAGCRFRPRCPQAFDACLNDPQMLEMSGGARVACWLHASQGRSVSYP
ncbi:MAG: ABC transporter ATP-binding protein [Hyphomicrobiales bacterium]